jgi:hypothetical protein
LLFVPTGDPFKYHWYAGVTPPFEELAVKITFAPTHAVVPVFGLILTDGVTFAVTVIVMVLLVDVTGFGQVEPLVNKQRTLFPFANVLVV